MSAADGTKMIAGALRRACEDIAALRARVDELEAAVRLAARELYVAEIHRQGVGWNDYCTSKLVSAQHRLARVLAERAEAAPSEQEQG